MSATVNMWLGVVFLISGLAATVLQAWLWGYPLENPDDAASDSTAPRSWTNLHRGIGAVYVVIYVVLMWQMVPRLWEYQIELPARTVVHATAGILIGVLLVAKFSIIRIFPHLSKGLPAIGLGLMACTVVLLTLSIPFAFQASNIAGDATEGGNVERVEKLVADLELEHATVEEVASTAGLQRGQRVLTTKCTQCHDLRTILARPRTARQWHGIVRRMAAMPNVGTPIEAEDIPYVTGYLIAITPDIHRSMRREREQRLERDAELTSSDDEDPQDDAAADEQPAPTARTDGSGVPDPSTEDSDAPPENGTADTDDEPGAEPSDDASTTPRDEDDAGEARADGHDGDAGDADDDDAESSESPEDDAEPADADAPDDTEDARTPSSGEKPPTDRSEGQRDKSEKTSKTDPLKYRGLVEDACVQCHGLSNIEDHGPDTRRGWTGVVDRMVDYGAEISPRDKRKIIDYLTAAHGK